ncbi:MAG: DUF4139 domain-containing protein [bacterium]|jgi:hypothetical protein
MKIRVLVLAAAFAATALSLCASASELSLTVYNDNFALVRDVRTTTLGEGINHLTVTDVAALLDPTSVHFKVLSGPSTYLLEQNFDYDLLSSDKLLSKYIGKEITLVDTQTGVRSRVKLLSTSGGMVVEKDGTVLLNPGGRVELSGGTGELLLEPTLNWDIAADKAGTVNYELSYMTSGMSWNCDYVFLLADTEKTGDMEGWVTLNNNSGATYRDAKLQLIAGDVRRVQEPAPAGWAGAVPEAAKMADGAGFQEESFFEYHLYTLPRATTIKMNQTKQISLLNAADIPTRKVYIYPGGDKVQVKVEFDNEEANNLGIALPKGKIRVFKRDSAGVPQFIGEDWVDHTPRKETVRLYIGDAFDIVGEKTQTNYSDIGKGYRETWQVKIKNRKEKEAITVVVPHQIYGDWKMVESNFDYVKKDAWTAEFKVPVAADGEATLNFTFEVRWK